jgi:ribosomal protein S27AE
MSNLKRLVLPVCPNCGVVVLPSFIDRGHARQCKNCNYMLIENSKRKYIVGGLTFFLAFFLPMLLFPIFGKSWYPVIIGFVFAIVAYISGTKYK